MMEESVNDILSFEPSTWLPQVASSPIPIASDDDDDGNDQGTINVVEDVLDSSESSIFSGRRDSLGSTQDDSDYIRNATLESSSKEVPGPFGTIEPLTTSLLSCHDQDQNRGQEEEEEKTRSAIMSHLDQSYLSMFAGQGGTPQYVSLLAKECDPHPNHTNEPPQMAVNTFRDPFAQLNSASHIGDGHCGSEYGGEHGDRSSSSRSQGHDELSPQNISMEDEVGSPDYGRLSELMLPNEYRKSTKATIAATMTTGRRKIEKVIIPQQDGDGPGSGSASNSATTTSGSDDSTSPKVRSQVVRHLCPYPHCDKHFSTNGHARRHSRIHDPIRPFKCCHRDCNATFTRRDNCHQHQRTRHQSA